MQGDALYTTEPMMKLCKEHNWEYIFTHKDTRQKNVAETYEWIYSGEGQIKKENLCKEKGIGSYVNHVEETAGKTETMNIFEYEYKSIERGKEKTTEFQWISSIELTDKNLEEMIRAGRSRWMIENEGFNNQKNGLYNICHINSRNSNAMKNHYLLNQVADIMMQIYLCWNPLIKEIGQSIKNTSSKLIESFQQHLITEEDVFYIKRYYVSRIILLLYYRWWLIERINFKMNMKLSTEIVQIRRFIGSVR